MNPNYAYNSRSFRIVIIGAGNVATHLALALANSQHRIVGVYSRTEASASALGQKLAQRSIYTTTTSQLDSIPEADIYLISVKDAALAAVAEAWPTNRKSGVVLHTAGSLPMTAIASTSNHYGVLYPMQTFSKDKAMDFNSVTCFLEGSDAVAENAARMLGETLGSKCVALSSEDRQFLHLAAVFACNFSNHMYTLAYELLEHRGINPNCMQPLIAETVAKLTQMHPREGQTGPAQRADSNVMNKHLLALADTPDIQELYHLISLSIIKRKT